ncbi:MAG TPA: TonB-dependent receptor [Bacteroidales bacterium]|nr:TonB-dependent receptor [Bacteroidales bacterium]
MYKGFKVANPSLGPEILDNIEAGADVTLFGSLRASLSAYYSTGTGFMYYISTGDSVNMGYKRSPVFIKENISRAEIMGLEADLDAEPFRWLSLFANYTYNHSVIARFQPRNPAVDADLTGKFLTDVPMHKASAGATVKTRMLNVHLLWKYTGRRYVNETNEPDPYLLYNRYPSFQTVSARVWRTFFGHLTVALNADNIFNVTFIDDRLQHSPGRMVTAEISATF